jgi:predicted TIM-barrel fold metal-dependent hydrolase
MLIDFHTHIFPENLASKAISKLADNIHIVPNYDGTTDGLLNYMNKKNVDMAVALNITVKPMQDINVNNFVLSIKNPRIIPFGSVHPYSDVAHSEIERLYKSGIRGLKFHPEYQRYRENDPKAIDIYRHCADLNMIMLFHCGYDCAYPNSLMCPPEDMVEIINKIPYAKIVAAHMGGNCMYERALNVIAGTPLYIDTSMSSLFCDKEIFKEFIKRHDSNKILWGTDGPWTDVNEDLKYIRDCGVSGELLDKIKFKNALKLLDLKI